MAHMRIPSKFKKSSQQRANLLQSSKLQRQAMEKRKAKWGFLSRKFKAKQTPLERLSRQFASQWKLKQSQKGHFSILRENRWKPLIKFAEKRAKALALKPKSLANNSWEKAPIRSLQLFLSHWESRLDVGLWKAHFFPSLAISRHFIRKGFIFVNGKKISSQGKILKKGDFVQIQIPNFKGENLWKLNLETPHGMKILKENQTLDSKKNLSPKEKQQSPDSQALISRKKIMPFLGKNPSLGTKPIHGDTLKNLLQQTLFFQTSGLDYSFFLGKKESLGQSLWVSDFQKEMLAMNGKLSLKNPKTHLLTKDIFLKNVDLQLPNSQAQNLPPKFYQNPLDRLKSPRKFEGENQKNKDKVDFFGNQKTRRRFKELANPSGEKKGQRKKKSPKKNFQRFN